MFDFHIHVNCSGGRGGLLPSEAMRLAKCAGRRPDRPGRSLDPADPAAHAQNAGEDLFPVRGHRGFRRGGVGACPPRPAA